ncbi:MAG: rRNA pseudouridine synthase [Candidatus Eremiobacteraeota bacterium]|nr:rRNA pseudouridine synthase [Candidatus Eremiobacteraeota bacterium]
MGKATRLNKFLARAGVASRRHADDLIATGRVHVNGRVVTELGVTIDEGDRVELDGGVVELPREHTYLLLHKPVGVVTTMSDPQRRFSVADLVTRPGLFPVGRLDFATSGALLLTDDGELAHRLLHPRFGVEKTYRASIAGRLSSEDVHRLIEGVMLPEFRAAAAKVRVVAVRRDSSVVDVTIHEGRNRQVRRMFQALGHRVLALTRTRFGPLSIGALAPGRFRELTPRERTALERHRRPPA